MDAALTPDPLSQSHLFRRLRETDRQALNEQAGHVSLNPGDVLYNEGQPAKALYVILQGTISLSRKVKGKSLSCGRLSAGDFFGIECISRNPYRGDQAAAHDSVSLLCIDRSQLLSLAQRAPQFKATLKTALNGQHTAASRIMAWLEPDEHLYASAHRHAIFLFLRLFLPVMLGIGALYFIVLTTETEQGVFTTAGVIGVLIAVFWGIWNYLDYYNDFYAITNKRIVWQEKIIGIYDSRQEAPSYAIRAVDYDASWIGRVIGFGTVTVRTFTGGVILDRIEDAQFVMDLIDEIRQKTASEKAGEERQSMRRILREQIGKEQNPSVQPQNRAAAAEPRLGGWELSFKTRLVQGDTVVYRKHWLILLSKTFLPLLSFLAAAALALGFAFSPEWETILNAQIGFSLGLLLALAAFLWTVYHYLDWRDDIYMVTAETLFDIERHPLGREEKKSAPLESVLSLSVERKNLLGVLFNFGDVVIDAGGTNLVFHNVYDPASAQLDVAARVDGLKRRKENARAAAENQRLAEWIGEYNEITRGE